MLQTHSPTRKREADLAAVKMSGEDELERSRLEPRHGVREVREQDAQVGIRLDETLGPARLPVPRIGADDLHEGALVREGHRRVLEESSPLRLDSRCVGRRVEGITARLDVVIPQDRADAMARAQPSERIPQPGFTSLPRQQIAGDGHEVVGVLLGPADRLLDRHAVQRERAEVQIREVEDRETVQLRRKLLQEYLDAPALDPLRLEQPPDCADPRRCEERLPVSAREEHLSRWRGKPAPPLAVGPGLFWLLARGRRRRRNRKDQGASSFWSTGPTGTTWRLNLSSDSSSPAATPISCERWRIGIW